MAGLKQILYIVVAHSESKASFCSLASLDDKIKNPLKIILE